MLTGACLYLGTLSVIMAIRAVALVSSWNAENRAADFASTLEVLRDAGLGASGAETFYKAFVTGVAVLAACGAVFALYTARGHRPSRVGLTIVVGVAGTATFLGVVGGTFLFAMIGALAVAFTVRLWTGEIGTYFRTLAGHVPPVPQHSSVDPFALPPQFSSDSGPAENVEYEPSTSGQSRAPSAPTYAPPAAAPQPPSAQAYAPPPGYHQPQPGREPLPRSVSIAVWTTLIGSAIVAAGAAFGLLGLLLVGDDYETMLRDSPVSESMLDQSGMDYDQLYRMSLTLLGLCLPLAVAGLAAATLVLVKKRKGDVFLFVMAVVTVVTSLLMFPIGLPWTAAALTCAVLLRKRESRAWFAKS
nr:hypothetical protein [Aeromicrobium sp.]